MRMYICGKERTKKNELNAKREQILPFMYSIFNLISHFIFMMNNKKYADVFFWYKSV